MLPPSWILRPCLEDSLPKLPLMDDITFCYNSTQRDWIHLQVLLLMDNILHQVNCIVLTQFVRRIFAANVWRTVAPDWMDDPSPGSSKECLFRDHHLQMTAFYCIAQKAITPCNGNKVRYEPEKKKHLPKTIQTQYLNIFDLVELLKSGKSFTSTLESIPLLPKSEPQINQKLTRPPPRAAVVPEALWLDARFASICYCDCYC